jgi:hypothetical protein
LATHSLGTRLKAQRESRGLALVQISDSTKIPLSLLEALERDDLSRWPKGFYGRAFFRAHVAALGLQPEPLVVEFARLSPDDDSPADVPVEGRASEPGAVAVEPLALSWAGPSTNHRLLRAVGIALLELIVITAIGAAIAWTTEVRWLEAAGATALVYLPIARLTADRSRRWLPGRYRASAPAVQPAAEAPAPRMRIAAHVVGAYRVVSPLARRSGYAASAFIGRTGRGVTAGSRGLGRMTARALAVGGHSFWKTVRAIAEHAELLANRQLNRTRE